MIYSENFSLFELVRRSNHQDISLGSNGTVGQVFKENAVVLGDSIFEVGEGRRPHFEFGHLFIDGRDYQSNGLGEAFGKSFQTCIQYGAKIGRVEVIGRQLNHLSFISEREIKKELFIIRQSGNHGLEAPLIPNSSGQRAIVRLGLDKADAEFSLGVLRHFL